MDAVTKISEEYIHTDPTREEIDDLLRKTKRTDQFEEGPGGTVRKKRKRHSGQGHKDKKDFRGDKPTTGGGHYNYTSRKKQHALKYDLKEDPWASFINGQNRNNTPESISTLGPTKYEEEDPTQIEKEAVATQEQWEIANDLNHEANPPIIGPISQPPTLSPDQAKEEKTNAKREKFFGRRR